MVRASSKFTASGELRARLKRIRLVRRWDQATLAQRAGVSAGTVSAIETGKVRPSDAQIGAIARALGYGTQFLTAELGLVPTSRPWLRAYADASRREADSRTELATLSVEYIRMLSLRPLPDLIPPIYGDLDDEQEIEEAAAEVRALASLDPDAVVGNAVRAAERLGCVVLPLDSEMGRHLAMSVRSDRIPVICVAKSGIPGDRQRFSVAHEIGHLALHAETAPPRDAAEASRMERQANRFAAAFLGPGDALMDTLHQVSRGRVTLNSLAEVKAVWGIAIKGLVGRYKSLGLIDANQAESLYKQISARRWTKIEPVEVPTESAQWFQRSIELTSGISGDPGYQVCAERIGGNAGDTRAFTDWQSVDATVVPITSLRRR